MMEYLIDNFGSYAETYIRVLIELYMFLNVILLVYWLNPFVANKRAVYASAAVYYALWIVCNHAGTTKEEDRLLTVGLIALSILMAWLLDNRRNPVQKIFLFVVFRLISWLSIELLSEIGFLESDLILRFEWSRNSLEVTILDFFIWNFLQYTLALLLLFFVIRILHRAYRYKQDELTWQELVLVLSPAWTLLLVKPIMSSYFMLWMDGIKNGSIKENIQANPYRILFCLFAYVPIVTVIILYQRLKEKQEEIFVKSSVENQIGDLSGHIEHIEKIYEGMRGLRHDLGNHLTVIERLAENGDTEELANYAKEFTESFERLQPKVVTGNAITDVILSEIAGQCEKEEIHFESTFSYPDKLDINPFDMSVILNNALKNALEASEMVAYPSIRIKTLQKAHVFIINLRNTIDHKIPVNDEGLPESSKHGAGHGYGLKNIRIIADKYKGDIEIRQEESEGRLFFILNIMLMGDQVQSATKNVRLT
ncbi:MAG: GHKL domain-containing protein [Lachnospiraceae bacterium]|nr:GHKL domain-containing protein [Lachnospiraceae bacterium]